VVFGNVRRLWLLYITVRYSNELLSSVGSG
jgi:hypothetical protein